MINDKKKLFLSPEIEDTINTKNDLALYIENAIPHFLNLKRYEKLEVHITFDKNLKRLEFVSVQKKGYPI